MTWLSFSNSSQNPFLQSEILAHTNVISKRKLVFEVIDLTGMDSCQLYEKLSVHSPKVRFMKQLENLTGLSLREKLLTLISN